MLHTKKAIDEVQAEVRSCDILYLGAGDTSLLMKTLCKWDLVDVIKEMYEKGNVIIGLSAGANVLFTKGYSDTGDGFHFINGMGIVEGVFCPHAQKEGRKAFVDDVNCGNYKLYPCDDYTAYIKLNDQEIYAMRQES